MTVTVTTNGPSGAAIDTRLTLLSLVNEAALEMGLKEFDRIAGDPDQTAKELLHFIQEACEEITRRVDWTSLAEETDLIGVGSAAAFELPMSFSRLIRGGAVYVNGELARGGLTNDEWNSLTPEEGQPRYYRLKGNTISFWPYMSTTHTAKVHYQSKYYTLAGRDNFVADDDLLVFPHQLAQKGLIWRWRRHVGQSFEDYLAEFEAALLDYANFDVKDRAA